MTDLVSSIYILNKGWIVKQPKQILAITGKIRKGKAKNVGKAKAKINQIRQQIEWNKFLAQ